MPHHFEEQLRIKELALEKEDRLIKKTRNGLLYYSKGDQNKKGNFSYKDKKGNDIVCRHLALWFILRNKEKEGSYHLESSIQKSEFLQNNFCDQKKIEFRGTFNYIFKLHRLGKTLYHLMKLSPDKNDFYLNLFSENHAMAIIIKKNNKYILVKFYDPNETFVHKTYWLKNMKALQSLSIYDFLSDRNIDAYFPVISPLLSSYEKELDYDLPLSQPKVIVGPYVTLKNKIYWGLLQNLIDFLTHLDLDLTNFKGDFLETFSCESEDSPALHNSLSERHSQSIQWYLKWVTYYQEKLSPILGTIIQAEDFSKKFTGFYIGLIYSNLQTIKIYLDVILSLNEIIDNNTLNVLFLMPQKNNRTWLLEILNRQDIEIFQVVSNFLYAIKDRLNKEKITSIFLFAPAGYTSNLEFALKNTQLAKVFIQLVESFQLDESDLLNIFKCDLIKHPDLIDPYKKVIQESNLDMNTKNKLCASEKIQQTNTFFKKNDTLCRKRKREDIASFPYASVRFQ